MKYDTRISIWSYQNAIISLTMYVKRMKFVIVYVRDA